MLNLHGGRPTHQSMRNLREMMESSTVTKRSRKCKQPCDRFKFFFNVHCLHVKNLNVDPAGYNVSVTALLPGGDPEPSKLKLKDASVFLYSKQ